MRLIVSGSLFCTNLPVNVEHLKCIFSSLCLGSFAFTHVARCSEDVAAAQRLVAY
jgi:hypothetical protein